MVIEILAKHLDEMVDVIMKLQDEDFKAKTSKFLELKKNDHKLLRDYFKEAIIETLSTSVSNGYEILYAATQSDHEIYNDQLFWDILDEKLTDASYLRKSFMAFIVHVSIDGFGKQLSRAIQVNEQTTLADFVFLTLASYHIDGKYPIEVKIGRHKYGLANELDENQESAKEIDVHSVLIMDEPIIITYGLNKEWEFRIERSENEAPEMATIRYGKVVTGKGYGIWEDHRDMLELYFKDRYTKVSVNGENVVVKNLIPFDMKEFDVRKINDDLLAKAAELSKKYE